MLRSALWVAPGSAVQSPSPSPFVIIALRWQGVPVRVEVGPRDVQQGSCVVSRRDQPGKQGKQFGVPLEPQPFVSHVQGLLQDIQDSLYADVSVACTCPDWFSMGLCAAM